MKRLSFLILLLMVAACGNNSDPVDKYETEIYHSTQGVAYSFLNDISYGVPGSEIQGAVVFENKGPYDTNVVFVANANQDLLQFPGGSDHMRASVALKGRDPVNPFSPDNRDMVQFRLQVKTPRSEEVNSEVRFNFCYDYRGELTTKVCIDQDPVNFAEVDKDCTIQKSLSVSGGQGGPVAINKIEYDYLYEGNSVQPRFKVYISNKGSGQIWRHGAADSVCTGQGLSDANYNVVELTDIGFSDFNKGDFECFPNPVKLGTLLEEEEEQYYNRPIVCTLRQGLPKSSVAYLTDLRVKIAYGYQVSVTKNIKIELNK